MKDNQIEEILSEIEHYKYVCAGTFRDNRTEKGVPAKNN